jgi:microcompartment protein CcmK/EutM
MRIAQVIGSITLSRPHPALVGARLLVAVPSSLQALAQHRGADGEEIIVWDDLGAGPGSWIGVSEGIEATMPFRPERKPIDAYCACLLDDLHFDAQQIKELIS